ncbi:MAG TPA: histone deacetylase [Solirubrobacteraceae bacterium]|nr:histone deacetylase [Solirubrobacteraceae bacterium]
MGRPVLFHHHAALEHDTGSHPERAARIVAVQRALAARDWLGCGVRTSPEATRTQLEAVHDPDYVERIEHFCAHGGGMLDRDTLVSAGSWTAAVHAAGGACALVDALLLGEAPAGASLHRPPGHHATANRAMGFCLFNNVAIAARHALDAHGLERVMIVDFDVHHGNGTNDIFHGHREVLFASLHEWPLYPGTGPSEDLGSGPGVGFSVNLPLPGGTGDATWGSVMEHVVVPLGRSYEPQLILVSAGFDAHRDDPLADCMVSDAGFAAMTASLRRLADALDVPLGLVLEGGYDVGALSRSLVACLEVLTADAAPEPDAGLAVDPHARAAMLRLRRRWPALDPEPSAG